jgi:uncharacterized protein Yka (UPF0111/DUF47 family)
MRRWFLPDMPDVVGLLRDQAATTVTAIEALVAWAEGDGSAADVVRAREHEADALKRALHRTLRTAFITPLDAEDLFSLSQLLDDVLNGAKDAVREAEALGLAPDPAIVAMARLVHEGTTHLQAAFALLGDAGGATDGATEAADAAIKAQRRLERVYRHAMRDLLELDDLRAAIGRQELLRRFVRVSDAVVATAERVWYAALKEA